MPRVASARQAAGGGEEDKSTVSASQSLLTSSCIFGTKVLHHHKTTPSPSKIDSAERGQAAEVYAVTSTKSFRNLLFSSQGPSTLGLVMKDYISVQKELLGL
jgi:hypothetical protein